MSRFSVIVPNYNSGSLLDRCLRALHTLRASYRPLLEVIVVDDASTDESFECAANYDVTAIGLEENCGPGAARNRGAEEASGEYLWFVDADVEVSSEALEELLGYLEQHPESAAIIGSYDDSPSDPGWCSQFKNLFHHYVHQQADDRVSTFWSGCGVIRADVFREVGGFDPKCRSLEDVHLGFRLTREGHEVRVLKSLQVKHLKKWTLPGLIRTDVLGRAMPWTMMLLSEPDLRSRELNLGWRARASVICVYVAVVCALASIRLPWSLVVSGVALGLVTLFNLELLIFFRKRRGWRFACLSVLLLFVYYAYCGVGFLLGFGMFYWEKLRGRAVYPTLSGSADRPTKNATDR